MNKRIVLVSIKDPGYVSIMGHPELSKRVILVENIVQLQLENKINEVLNLLNLGEGDGALLVGSPSFYLLSSYYHFGIRNENFDDCVKLERLSISGGAYVKCVKEPPSVEIIDSFLSPSFSADMDFSWFKHKTIHTYPEAISFLNWASSLPIDTRFGFDYETSGMALDKEFYVSGLSLCTTRFGAFISLTDLRRTAGKDEFDEICIKIANFLQTRQDYLFVFNSQFEFQVSHRVFGVDLYNLCDSQVVNVLNGDHLHKKYSLKWTAQRILKAKVWDTDFDYLNKLLDDMYFSYHPKTGKRLEDLKVTPGNYRLSPEWGTICSRYPDYIEEFERLIGEYWGMPYMNIPSDILGFYCNLDSFYTLMIYEVTKDQFPVDAWNTFFDNARLAVRLHSSGLYIDKPFRLRYEKESLKMMAWGITYCSCVWTYLRKKELEKYTRYLGKLHPVVKKLVESSKFFSGNLVEVVKNILKENIDTMDAYELGINEGSLLMEYGPDFAADFVDRIRLRMEESGLIKTMKKTGQVKIQKLDEGVVRKKKLITLLVQDLYELLDLKTLTTLKIDNSKLELIEEYYKSDRLYLEFQSIFKNQMPSIESIPETITYLGNTYSLQEYSTILSKTVFKCTSPKENDKMVTQFYDLFQAETCFIGSLVRSMQQLEGGGKFYSSRGITDITEAFEEYMTSWKEFNTVLRSGMGVKKSVYPRKVFDWSYDIWAWKSKRNKTETPFDTPEGEVIKEVWTQFEGLNCQSSLFNQFRDEFVDYGTPWSVNDTQDRFYFMRKLLVNYLLFKKYAKVLSTYVNGMFSNTRWVIEGDDHIPLRYADPNEPGAVEKCFVRYEVNTKSSKRWSSGFHTILAHSDLKDIICCPPAWDKDGNIVYGGSDMLLTYFDISSAEVKAAGFASMDPDLIAKFRSGEDIYIYSALLYLGEEAWDKLTAGEKKKWRKRFKTIFLGVLYGLGKRSLAERLNSTEDEAEDIIQGLYKSFPQLRAYVEIQQQYPLDHGGFVNTMLGDRLWLPEYGFLQQAKNQWEIKDLIAKIKRRGVNYPVQGGTSSIMASGFMNNIRVSLRDPRMPVKLQPIIVVHDSNTNYFGIRDLFSIRKFYDINYTGFCETVGPKIKLLFDLLVGPSYESAAPMTTIDDNTIEFTGNAYGLGKLYDKIMRCPDIRVECDTPRESLVPNFINHPIDRFIREGGTSIIKDTSKYTIRFKKLEGGI